MVKIIFSTIALILIFTVKSTSVDLQGKSNSVKFDAFSFQSDSSDFSRLDCFVIIPFSQLKFKSYKDIYVSDVNIVFDFKNEITNQIKTVSTSTKVIADSYYQSQGGDASFETILEKVYLKPGTYDVKATISNQSENIVLNSEIVVKDYNKNVVTLSNIMLVSAIEEGKSGLKITPFFDKNVYTLDGDFFAFFEIYNSYSKDYEVQYLYKMIGDSGIVGKISKPKYANLKLGSNKDFLKIDNKKELIGVLDLVVEVYPKDITEFTSDNLLSTSTKEINFTNNEFDGLLGDIDLSIRQLRYIANQETIEKFKNTKSEKEKRKLFLEFWNQRDPTPRTSYNEALNEYYSRVKYASENFKSYSAGWLTDMGMIFIVLGPPSQVMNDNQNMSSNISYERWIYGSGREFIFEDRTNFGDYRLVRPMGFNEKYEYGR